MGYCSASLTIWGIVFFPGPLSLGMHRLQTDNFYLGRPKSTHALSLFLFTSAGLIEV